MRASKKAFLAQKINQFQRMLGSGAKNVERTDKETAEFFLATGVFLYDGCSYEPKIHSVTAEVYDCSIIKS